MKINKNGIKN